MKAKNIFFDQLSFFISVPALLWQFFFLYFPLLFIICISFIEPTSAHLTLAHYRSLLYWPYLSVILRSFVLALGNSLISLCIAYPVAYFLAVHVKRWKSILLFFMILPFWTSLLVQVYAWVFVLEPYGVVNTLFIKLGLITEPLQMLNSLFAVFLGMVYCYVPFMVVPLYSTLESLDSRLLEASADLGASTIETFRRITLPLSLPGIRTGFFLVFIPSFGEFVIPALLGGGKRMYVGTLISHYFLILQDMFTGAALTVICGLVLLLSVLLVYYMLIYSIALLSGKVSR